MQLDERSYGKYVDLKSEKTDIFANILKAFATGGIICVIGEAFYDLFIFLSVSAETSKMLAPLALIFITAILTGFGIFDNITHFAGAGTLVPITGFANAVISPAIDNKYEGYILGVGSKMFVIAGPVIVYGTIASVIYGVVYYCRQALKTYCKKV